jgi:hypothetical protein
MDGWSDEGGREVGSQKLEDQGQGQRRLEAITGVGQDPAWVAAPGWMDGWMDGDPRFEEDLYIHLQTRLV